MISKKTIRKCPICDGINAEILHTQQFVLPESISLPNKYNVVSCEFCGFVYADTQATQEDYNEYYTNFSKYEDPKLSSGGLNNKWDLEKFTKTTEFISRFINKESSILDIGCANGGLLALLKQQGYYNLTGLDPSSTCVSYIKKAYGIRAIQGGISNLVSANDLFPTEKFDLIILSHVLEHLIDLHGAIEILTNKLNDGACLYIETPDAQNYGNYPVVPFYYFDCEHINHFDINSIRNLVEPKGLTYVSGINKSFSVSKKDIYPAVAAIFRREPPVNDRYILYNDQAKRSVIEHICDSKCLLESQKQFPIVEKTEKVIIWGAGSYAMRLLGDGLIEDSNLVAFVDNDSKKHGSTFCGKIVGGADLLQGNEYTVLVCSALFSQEIVEQIDDLGIKRRVVVL